MAELLFIATTVFVAYVLFSVIGNDKQNQDTQNQPDEVKPDIAEKAAKPSEITAPSPKPVPAPAPAVAKVEAKPEKSSKKPTASKAKAAPAKKAEPAKAASDSLKNPATGEVAKVPSNYAFAKRWIKEALVEEGLLEKVYKNNELDTEATAKIQAALEQLKAMDKYQ